MEQINKSRDPKVGVRPRKKGVRMGWIRDCFLRGRGRREKKYDIE